MHIDLRMKTIMKTILMLAVLCLAGCSGEDSRVSFSIHEIDAPNDATEYSVDISANCPWIISDDNPHTYTNIRTGEGDMQVRLVVFSNQSTDDQTYKVTIQSRDGTSSDELTIHQEAWKDTQTEEQVSLPAEGGEFVVDVLSNDNMKDMDLPEWISFVSSRALNEHAFTFRAEPNMTGKERTGKIHLYGEDSQASTLVTQEPYAPTGVEVEDITDVLLASDRTYSFPIRPVPDYAGYANLEARMSAGSAYIEGGYLHVRCGTPGTCTLEILLEDKAVYSKELTFITPDIPLAVKDGDEYCIAQPFDITTGIPQEYVEITVSDATALKQEGERYAFTKEGTVEVTARNILSGNEARATVSSSYITIQHPAFSLIQVNDYCSLIVGTTVNMYDAISCTIYTTCAEDGEHMAVKEEPCSGKGKLTSVNYNVEIKGTFKKEDVEIHAEFLTADGRTIRKSVRL